MDTPSNSKIELPTPPRRSKLSSLSNTHSLSSAVDWRFVVSQLQTEAKRSNDTYEDRIYSSNSSANGSNSSTSHSFQIFGKNKKRLLNNTKQQTLPFYRITIPSVENKQDLLLPNNLFSDGGPASISSLLPPSHAPLLMDMPNTLIVSGNQIVPVNMYNGTPNDSINGQINATTTITSTSTVATLDGILTVSSPNAFNTQMAIATAATAAAVAAVSTPVVTTPSPRRQHPANRLPLKTIENPALQKQHQFQSPLRNKINDYVESCAKRRFARLFNVRNNGKHKNSVANLTTTTNTGYIYNIQQIPIENSQLSISYPIETHSQQVLELSKIRQCVEMSGQCLFNLFMKNGEPEVAYYMLNSCFDPMGCMKVLQSWIEDLLFDGDAWSTLIQMAMRNKEYCIIERLSVVCFFAIIHQYQDSYLSKDIDTSKLISESCCNNSVSLEMSNPNNNGVTHYFNHGSQSSTLINQVSKCSRVFHILKAGIYECDDDDDAEGDGMEIDSLTSDFIQFDKMFQYTEESDGVQVISLFCIINAFLDYQKSTFIELNIPQTIPPLSPKSNDKSVCLPHGGIFNSKSPVNNLPEIFNISQYIIVNTNTKKYYICDCLPHTFKLHAKRSVVKEITKSSVLNSLLNGESLVATFVHNNVNDSIKLKQQSQQREQSQSQRLNNRMSAATTATLATIEQKQQNENVSATTTPSTNKQTQPRGGRKKRQSKQNKKNDPMSSSSPSLSSSTLHKEHLSPSLSLDSVDHHLYLPSFNLEENKTIGEQSKGDGVSPQMQQHQQSQQHTLISVSTNTNPLACEFTKDCIIDWLPSENRWSHSSYACIYHYNNPSNGSNDQSHSQTFNSNSYIQDSEQSPSDFLRSSAASITNSDDCLLGEMTLGRELQVLMSGINNENDEMDDSLNNMDAPSTPPSSRSLSSSTLTWPSSPTTISTTSTHSLGHMSDMVDKNGRRYTILPSQANSYRLMNYLKEASTISTNSYQSTTPDTTSVSTNTNFEELKGGSNSNNCRDNFIPPIPIKVNRKLRPGDKIEGDFIIKASGRKIRQKQQYLCRYCNVPFVTSHRHGACVLCGNTCKNSKKKERNTSKRKDTPLQHMNDEDSPGFRDFIAHLLNRDPMDGELQEAIDYIHKNNKIKNTDIDVCFGCKSGNQYCASCIVDGSVNRNQIFIGLTRANNDGEIHSRIAFICSTKCMKMIRADGRNTVKPNSNNNTRATNTSAVNTPRTKTSAFNSSVTSAYSSVPMTPNGPNDIRRGGDCSLNKREVVNQLMQKLQLIAKEEEMEDGDTTGDDNDDLLSTSNKRSGPKSRRTRSRARTRNTEVSKTKDKVFDSTSSSNSSSAFNSGASTPKSGTQTPRTAAQRYSYKQGDSDDAPTKTRDALYIDNCTDYSDIPDIIVRHNLENLEYMEKMENMGISIVQLGKKNPRISKHFSSPLLQTSPPLSPSVDDVNNENDIIDNKNENQGEDYDNGDNTTTLNDQTTHPNYNQYQPHHQHRHHHNLQQTTQQAHSTFGLEYSDIDDLSYY